MVRDVHELREEKCYYKDGVFYLPHYRNPNIFIGPGYPRYNITRYTEGELVNLGARVVEKMLWPRKFTDVVSDSYP